jgi:N-acetylglutamate synthase-like GNAT family acetyltransferase
MVITRANTSDLPGIFGLLRDNGLPFEGVAKDLRNFLVIKDGREIIGCAGLEIHGRTGLLRSVAVKKERQGQGLGMTLISRIFNLARNKNIKKLYLLTSDSSQFFSRFGFERIERNKVDPVIQQAEMFTCCCPCSSIVMVKDLNTGEKNDHIARRT